MRDPAELCRRLRLPPKWEARAQAAAERFPLMVPEPYLARIRPGDPHDPLLRQVLPLEAELATVAGFSADPVGDRQAQIAPKLLQKYHGRALLMATGACAVHCRYCFRRHWSDADSQPAAGWQPALQRIAADPTIDEVILSGGDPLVLTDGQLAGLAARLAAIGHVRRLRVHTRLPVVIPERVTDELLAWLVGVRNAACGLRGGTGGLSASEAGVRLAACGMRGATAGLSSSAAGDAAVSSDGVDVEGHRRSLTPVVVVHANHPNELDDAVLAALDRLVDAGIVVLNQAVLLRGVNDDAGTLESLCRRLIDHRVMPYYLHQLDRVAGAAHFEVPPKRGHQLLAHLHRHLPGYAVPRYVQEVPGATSKLDVQ